MEVPQALVEQAFALGVTEVRGAEMWDGATTNTVLIGPIEGEPDMYGFVIQHNEGTPQAIKLHRMALTHIASWWELQEEAK